MTAAEDGGSELQELQWGTGDLGGLRGGSGGGGSGSSSSHYLRSGSHYLRGGSGGSCYEAEDLEPPSRHHHSARDRGYYSPPGTSYTIVERPPSAPHHHSSHTTPYRSHRSHGTTGGGGAISPEQVIRLFGNGLQERRANERRTPASSPASVAALRNSSASVVGGERSGRESNNQTPQPLSIQDLQVRTVTMTREPPDSHHGFGICVKGGKDAGVGVYISRVEEGSVAERAGLRPGDTILEVNGTPFRAVTHEEALKMLKSCRMLSMTVRGPAIDPRCRGNHPIYPANRQQTCSWIDRQGRPASPPPVHNPRDSRYGPRTRKVDLCIEHGQSLGLMIRGGLEFGLGIYVTGVDKDSVADRAGLMVGDQILEVNGQSFEEAMHDEAVHVLKTSKRMSMLIRDVGKVPHSCTTDQSVAVPVPRYQDHDSLLLESPANHRPPSPENLDWRHRGLQPISAATAAMVEEKARIVLARSERAALSQLLADYRARRLTVEDLVVSLVDLLNTNEKLTLLTELRELVESKDRPIFDDLVYRPRLSRRKNDRAHDSDIIVTPSLHELPRVIDESGCCRPGRLMEVDGDPLGATGPLLVRDNQEYRSPSEDSGLGPEIPRTRGSFRRSQLHQVATSDLALFNDDEFDNQDYDDDINGERGDRRHSSPGHPRSNRDYLHHHLHPDNLDCDGVCEDSEMMIGNGPRRDRGDTEDDEDECRKERSSESGGGGGFGGWRNHLLGGLTQRVKSWYWGARPLELSQKLSRSFDIQEAQLLDEAASAGGAGSTNGPAGTSRRHHSSQRLARAPGDPPERREEDAAVVVPDAQGNLRITIKKTKPHLGIVIEGGADTKHFLPRIIHVHESGSAYEAGGLEVGQLILEVDGQKIEGLRHHEAARQLAEAYARKDRNEIEFLVVEAKKSNLEPKPTALIFLES